jgi:DNA-binding transcriptional ArsR family regulator
MAAGLVLLAFVSFAPGLALDEVAPALPDAEVSAGPVAVSAHDGRVAASAETPVPVGLDADLRVPGVAGVAVDTGTEGRGRAVEPAGASASASAAQRWIPPALQEAPPAAVAAAGGSFLFGGLAFALWFAFSRIEDGDLASHPLRRQALDLIAASPGASVRDVQRSLGIAWGTAVYHLGRLERAGLVAVRRVGGRSGHWPLGQAPPRDAPAPTGQALADLVRRRPGLTQSELAELAGIGAPAACKQLRRLESAGLVLASRMGRTRVYRPAEALVAA